MSLRTAINAKCKDCIYDRLAGGTWRRQVEACTATTCPLYPYPTHGEGEIAQEWKQIAATVGFGAASEPVAGISGGPDVSALFECRCCGEVSDEDDLIFTDAGPACWFCRARIDDSMRVSRCEGVDHDYACENLADPDDGGGLCKSCRAKVDAMEAQYEMGKELA